MNDSVLIVSFVRPLSQTFERLTEMFQPDGAMDVECVHVCGGVVQGQGTQRMHSKRLVTPQTQGMETSLLLLKAL